MKISKTTLFATMLAGFLLFSVGFALVLIQFNVGRLLAVDARNFRAEDGSITEGGEKLMSEWSMYHQALQKLDIEMIELFTVDKDTFLTTYTGFKTIMSKPNVREIKAMALDVDFEDPTHATVCTELNIVTFNIRNYNNILTIRILEKWEYDTEALIWKIKASKIADGTSVKKTGWF